MVRKVAMSGCITVLALVAGCTAGASSPASGRSGHSASAITAVSSASPCPAGQTKKFARALYVTDAGLAAGAFTKWIYAPYTKSAFARGVTGRPGAIAKAAAASGYVVSQLQEVKASAQSDPALCRLTIGAIDKLTSTVRAIGARAKAGSVSPAQVTSAAAFLSRLQAASAEAGAAFRAQSVSSLPASD